MNIYIYIFFWWLPFEKCSSRNGFEPKGVMLFDQCNTSSERQQMKQNVCIQTTTVKIPFYLRCTWVVTCACPHVRQPPPSFGTKSGYGSVLSQWWFLAIPIKMKGLHVDVVFSLNVWRMMANSHVTNLSCTPVPRKGLEKAQCNGPLQSSPVDLGRSFAQNNTQRWGSI